MFVDGRSYTRQQALLEALRRIAREHKVHIVTATQCPRSDHDFSYRRPENNNPLNIVIVDHISLIKEKGTE